MSASFAGAAAASSSGDADRTFDNLDAAGGEDLWLGQEVEVKNGSQGFEEAVRIYHGLASDGTDDADRVDTLRADGDNVTFTVDEDTFEDGEPYFLVDTSTDADSGTFWVNEQEVDFEFEDSIVDPDETNAQIDYEEIGDEEREDYFHVNVSAELDGETVDSEDLNATLGDFDFVEEHEEDDIVEVNVSGTSDDWDVDFSSADEGDYEFTFDVTDTTASDTAEITVTDVEADALFADTTYDGVAGDVVEMTVEFENTDELLINVTAEDEDFFIGDIEITNLDQLDLDEEELNIEINTYNVGVDDDEAVTVTDNDGDDIEDNNANVDADFETLLDGEPMPALDYELELFTDTSGGDEVDAAFLTLEEGEFGDVNTWVAPEDLDLEDAEDDLDEFLGSATERDNVAQEDLLITEVEATGVYGYLFDDDYEMNDSHGVTVTFEEIDDSVFGEAGSFNVSDDQDNLTVVPDADAGTFYIVLDTDEEFDGETLDADTEWEITVEVDESNDYIDDEEDEISISTEFAVEERELEIVGDFDDDDRLEVPNTEDSEITAESNVAPGSEVDYRLRFPSDVVRGDAVVDEDGLAVATFDLSNYDGDVEISSIRATGASGEEDDIEGVVVDVQDVDEPEEAAFDLAVDYDDEIVEGDDLDVDATVTNTGDEEGEVTVDFKFDGADEDSKTLTLDGGESATAAFSVSDLDAGTYDFTVTADDQAYDGSVEVVKDEKPDDDEAADDEAADDEAADDEAADDEAADDDDDEPADDDTPGFGIAVALAALLGAAMLALRRQN